MVSSAAAPGQVPTLRPPPSVVNLWQTLLVACTCTILVVPGWLCIRHLSGKLQQPLGFPAMLAVGVISAAAVSALRCGWWRTGLQTAHRGSLAAALWLLPTVAVLLLAAALTLRGTSTAALGVLWGSLLLNELMWGRYGWRLVRRDPTRAPANEVPPPTVAASAVRRHATAPPDRLAEGSDEGELSLASDVSQQITRSQSRQHGDTVAGVLRALFQPGERSRNLHVAFCPPMPSRPTVEVIQLSGPRTRVKVADVQSFGVRFDLRLVTASQQEENVLIHFEARCSV
ncbi:MAG: hypothetical protein ACYC0X_09795 [Pirellulaceae bacterium]